MLRPPLIWATLCVLIVWPIWVAAQSPYLVGRDAIYVIASFAGIVGLVLLFVQPLLAGLFLPGPGALLSRKWHRYTGALVAIAVVLHVGGLYLTSPMDALDALLLVSPTPFSIYGVTAMWAVFITVIIAVSRRPLQIRYRLWRGAHLTLAIVIAAATIAHALMIEGLMGQISKLVLSAAVVCATAALIFRILQKRPV